MLVYMVCMRKPKGKICSVHLYDLQLYTGKKGRIFCSVDLYGLAVNLVYLSWYSNHKSMSNNIYLITMGINTRLEEATMSTSVHFWKGLCCARK